MIAPILVTGAAGFAGSHLLDLLGRDEAPIVAWRRPGPMLSAARTEVRARWMEVELLDRADVAARIADVAPAAIYHCAGAPHVAESWHTGYDTLAANVLATHHLVDAVRRARLNARILIPSSALVYRPADRAISEDDEAAPTSPYGFSKLAQELVGLRAVAHDGLAVVVARSFNHVGPRQDPAFFASSFARQIALIEAGEMEPVMRVGNLDARRDLTDVRDTVNAYRALVEHGRPGAVYNVCSGRAYAVREVLDALIARARVRLRVDSDPARQRPHDIPLVLGDSRRIREEIGWTPAIPLTRTLDDLLAFWRAEIHQPSAPRGA